MVITKRPSSLRWNLGSVSSEATHGSCVLEVIKLVSCAGNYSWSHVEVTQVVLVLKSMKGSWGATEACHCVADLEPLKKAWRGCWWKCSPVVTRDSSIGQLPRTAAVVEWSQPELRRQSVWAAQVRARDVTRVLWRSHEDSVDPRFWTLSYLHSWNLILLCSDCNCSLVLPSWSKKAFMLLFIL